MLFLIFLVIGLISVVAALIFKNKAAIIGSLAFMVLVVIIPVGIYSSNIGKIADLEAFYNASATNFQISRDDTASYLSEDKIQSNVTLIPITGSIEKMGVGQSVANRVLEYRNSVNDYNSAFAKYKAYKGSLLYGIAYPSVPSEMRLLVINPVSNGSSNNYDGGTTITTNNSNVSGVPQPSVTTQSKISQEDLSNALKQAIQDALKNEGK
jgi:hypothetical protein